MKIAKIRFRKLTGTMETNGPFWEERLLRPIDIYPEYRRGGRTEGGEQVDDKHLRLVQYFLNIETDEGIVGRAGPVGPMPPGWCSPSWLRSSSARTRGPSNSCGIRCIVCRCMAARVMR